VDFAAKRLPPNVTVHEFFMKSGAWLRHPVAQQNYVSSNYTHIARDMIDFGVNVFCQAVAKGEVDGQTYLSLSSNADSSDLWPMLEEIRGTDRPFVLVGETYANLPFMYHDAMTPIEDWDFVLDNRAYDHTLLGPPNMAVTTADYLIGLYASTLVRDGGTLQIGIGSLGDAIAYGLCQREQNNAAYLDALKEIGATDRYADSIAELGGTGRFQEGLYGSSEMFCDAFRHLRYAGVLKRKVYDWLPLQRLVSAGQVQDEKVTPELLDGLVEDLGVHSHLTAEDVAQLKKFGVFNDQVQYADGALQVGGESLSADLGDPAAAQRIKESCLGDTLKNGIVLHGGFYLGPQGMYKALLEMSEEERKLICMTGVSKVNQLYGAEELATLQRKDARFMNTAMIATLMGSVASDGLENGSVVSGVGGQYNFVAMGHALKGARSIIMLRSSRMKAGEPISNILFNYGHCTIPRHLRDIVITEYGIARLRGKCDKDVIAGMLNISDSRFQEELLNKAKELGKIPKDYQIPAEYRNNYPDRLEARLKRFRKDGMFPPFPFECDLTDTEIALGKCLKGLKAKMSRKRGAMKAFAGAMKPRRIPESAKPYLERMKLDTPDSTKEKIVAKLIVAELEAAGII
jgi:acyl-CoA hydrolase